MFFRKVILSVAVVALLVPLASCCPCICGNPSIDVEKYVAYGCPTAGTIGDFYDADDPSGLTVPFSKSVWYQLIITNTGDVELTDVELSDDALFGSMSIGTLLPGETVTIDHGPIRPELGQNNNIATVIGYYGSTMVEDSDAANYYCPSP